MATPICIQCGQPLDVPKQFQGTVEYRGADGQRYTIDYGAGAWMHLDCSQAQDSPVKVTMTGTTEVASGRQQPE